MRRRFLLVLPAMLSIGLVSCTASPEPDWELARSQADAFLEAARTSGNFLGGGFLSASAEDEVLLDEEGLTLEYPLEIRVEGIRAVCFGSGEASFGAMVRAGSFWTAIDPVVLTCDGEPRTVSLETPLERINAVSLNGRGADDAALLIAAAVTGTAG